MGLRLTYRNRNNTRNTTPAKPRESRFGYIWFVCDLKFQGWCSKSGSKSNTHCASYIVHQLTADHILTSWKMAASSVLKVNYRGEALFVNVFVPHKKTCLWQNVEQNAIISPGHWVWFARLGPGTSRSYHVVRVTCSRHSQVRILVYIKCISQRNGWIPIYDTSNQAVNRRRNKPTTGGFLRQTPHASQPSIATAIFVFTRKRNLPSP